MSRAVGFVRGMGTRSVNFVNYVGEVISTNYKGWLANKGVYLAKDVAEHQQCLHKWFYTKAFRLGDEVAAIGEALRGNLKVYHVVYTVILVQFDLLIYHYMGRWLERGSFGKVNFEYFMEMDQLRSERKWYERRQPVPRSLKDGQYWYETKWGY
eukprot:TRINITY_DN12568_c0_g1_i2.p1 TRINITY_DN12568_c0_g1~~TRINITY_DN12568_c0_g1_i2.p1  ORF type:complete len:154 (+),score=5.95 TRINITY_DN12568_c0_g1_i2:90-551(+)